MTEETVTIDLVGYTSTTIESGWLGVVNSNKLLSMHSCRERFHSAYSPHQIKGILFGCPDSYKFTVENLVLEIERLLGIDPAAHTKFYHVHRPNLLLVNPSEWWTGIDNYAISATPSGTCSIRCQFLTILLRVPLSPSYNESNELFNRLNAHAYFAKTKSAVELFLNGATVMKENAPIFTGWVSCFEYKDPSLWLEKKKELSQVAA